MKVLLSVLLLITLAYLGYLIVLGRSINNASKEGQKTISRDIYDESITGKISLRNPQNLNCFSIMDIISNNGKKYESIILCPCKNKEFLEFVSDEDSIAKAPNSFEAVFIKKNGLSKTIELPLCK